MYVQLKPEILAFIRDIKCCNLLKIMGVMGVFIKIERININHTQCGINIKERRKILNTSSTSLLFQV